MDAEAAKHPTGRTPPRAITYIKRLSEELFRNIERIHYFP